MDSEWTGQTGQTSLHTPYTRINTGTGTGTKNKIRIAFNSAVVYLKSYVLSI